MNKKRVREEDESEFILDINKLEFISSSKLLEGLQCPICLQIMLQPIYLKTCQHTFCEPCFEHLFTNKEGKVPCPNCRAEVSKTDKTNSITHQVLLDLLECRCPSKECTWKGHYKNVEDHLKNWCYWLFLCECGIVCKKESKHKEICPLNMMSCVCGSTLVRKELDRHRQTKCPEEEILCTHHDQGCNWSGKRQVYNDTHSKECKIIQLSNRCDLLLKKVKLLDSSENSIYIKYKSSEGFITCGLTDEKNTTRRNLIRKYSTSKLSLGFPVSFGGVENERLEMTSLISDGLFESMKQSSIWHSVLLEVDKEQGILSLTLGGKHDRFFIVLKSEEENKAVNVTKHCGRVVIEFPNPDLHTPSTSFMIMAHRRWLRDQNGLEIPFSIIPNPIHYNKFNLRCSNKEKNEEMFLTLCNFFHQ